MYIFFTLFTLQVSITVYNDNLGLVKDVREFEFKNGINTVYITNVASRIDPTSLGFSAEGVNILEQNYEYDLVSADKLLTKYLDKEISIFLKDGNIKKGKLLAFDGKAITLGMQEGAITIVQNAEILRTEFPELPEGLITTPTLVWLVKAENSGRRKCEISYLTEGIRWHAEYIGIVEDGNMDFSGWVTIDNRSGATYKDAKLKVVAGTVHRVARDKGRREMEEFGGAKAVMMDESRFEERVFLNITYMI